MFTIKFLNVYDPESHNFQSIQACIECPHYEVVERGGGEYTVTTYMDMTKKSGVDRHVTSQEDVAGGFQTCYIMNSSGKTIDRVSCHGPVGSVISQSE